MVLRRLSLLLFAALLITSWRGGHLPLHFASPWTSIEAGGVATQTILPTPSRSLPHSLSPFALVAYRLKSEREETDSLISQESDLRGVALRNRFVSSAAQSARPDPFRAIVPLRC